LQQFNLISNPRSILKLQIFSMLIHFFFKLFQGFRGLFWCYGLIVTRRFGDFSSGIGDGAAGTGNREFQNIKESKGSGLEIL
jgi:hypothetical protein